PMRILYGVPGEGMGHATRSKVILEHLIAKHEVQVIVSGRAHGILTRAFPGLPIHEEEGLSMVCEANRFRKWKTCVALIKKPPRITDNFELVTRISEAFDPELVISDFESLAYFFSKERELPVLSIDNMEILNRCELEIEIPEEELS